MGCAGRKPPAQYLDGPPNNHDGVVQGPLCLLHKLLSATAEDDGASLSFGAASEEIVPTSRVKSYIHVSPCMLPACCILASPKPPNTQQLHFCF